MKLIFQLAAFILTIVISTGCSEHPNQLSKGQLIPPFSLERLQQGSLHYPGNIENKVVAILFWADWCSFCETEMKNIEPLYQRYHDQGLEVLAINLMQERETAQAFINNIDISYDVLLDEQGKVAEQFGVIALPVTFIIDRSGGLHTRILGETSPEVFEQVITELL